MRITPEIKVTLKELCATLDCPCTRDTKTVITAITTDSRLAENGDIFIPLKGERVDGRAFIGEAKKKGALILSDVEKSDIFVKDIERALCNIVSLYLRKADKLKHRIALTGSVGKSTTKEFLFRILSVKYKVHKTKENQNNLLGVFYTAISVTRESEIFLAELGMNHKGEIKMLSEAISPDVSLITNIGNAHIGNLGSREEIANAKLEILCGMKEGGLIVPHGEKLLDKKEVASTFSSTDMRADVFINKRKNKKGTIDVVTPHRYINSIPFSVIGDHNLENLAAAIAVADLLRFKNGEIVKGVKSITEDLLRARIINLKGFKIYDDTYSSSPEAMKAVLEMIAKSYDKKSCLIGDMLELGDKSPLFHKEIGRIAAKLGYNRIYTYGIYGAYVAAGALEWGMNKERIHICNSTGIQKCVNDIIKYHDEGEIIVFKGSHKMHLEYIYQELIKKTEKLND